MQDFGVNLLIVKDGIDSAGPSGKIMIPVLSAVAELERENIREQTMAGRRQKANTLVPWGSDWWIESWILYGGWTMMRQGCTRSLLRRFYRVNECSRYTVQDFSIQNFCQSLVKVTSFS